MRQSTRSSLSHWPTADDYQSAMQNLSLSMSDTELQSGVAAENIMGMPLLYSGGIADVYRVECASTGNTWAVKCFKRPTAGLQERYAKISDCLQEKRLPFMVDFEYLDKGIRIANHWYPILKMQWVEGQTLGEYIQSNLSKPDMLDQLLLLWVKLATWLDRAGIAHADLQHGNVMLVPVGDDGTVSLKLVDYDGMWVPALAGSQATELGHPNFQHPQRARDRIYKYEVDRFSHLVICTAIRSLRVGGRSLWSDFDNEDNLLFTAKDFEVPSESRLMKELWTLTDRRVHTLLGNLILATQNPLQKTPLIQQLIVDGQSEKLSVKASQRVRSILGGVVTEIDDPVSELPNQEEIERKSEKITTPPPPTSSPSTKEFGKKIRARLQVVQRRTSIAYDVFLAQMRSLYLYFVDRVPHESEKVRRRIVLAVGLVVIILPTALFVFRDRGFENSVGMKMRYIPAGRFIMGEKNAVSMEHEVVITSHFYIAATEVTQHQWETIMGTRPWANTRAKKGANFPATYVSWHDAVDFCRRLSAQEGIVYSLPSEAQWEYACRAGSTTNFSFGEVGRRPWYEAAQRRYDARILQYAWLDLGGTDRFAHEVQMLRANRFGLFDMHGNVSEWCLDSYQEEFYATSPKNDPLSTKVNADLLTYRTHRGGDWRSYVTHSSGTRTKTVSDGRSETIGFRVIAFPSSRDTNIETVRQSHLSASAIPEPICVGTIMSEIDARIEDGDFESAKILISAAPFDGVFRGELRKESKNALEQRWAMIDGGVRYERNSEPFQDKIAAWQAALAFVESDGQKDVSTKPFVTIVLTDFGNNRADVIRQAAIFSRISETDSLRFFSDVPVMLMEAVPREAAERMRNIIEKLGGAVELK